MLAKVKAGRGRPRLPDIEDILKEKEEAKEQYEAKHLSARDHFKRLQLAAQ